MRTTRLPGFTSFTKSSHVMQRCLALIHTNQSILHFSFLPVSLLPLKHAFFMGHQPFVTSQRSSISPSRCLRSVCNCLALIPSTHVEGAGNQCREAVNIGLIMPFLLFAFYNWHTGWNRKIWYIMGWLRAVHWK